MDLEGVAATVGQVAERVGPAVVGVGRDGRGAGLVVAEGLVLTNAHNLRGPTVTLSFVDGRVEAAPAAGVDGDGDLAVLQVSTGAIAPVEWGGAPSPGHPALGEPVLVVAPAGQGRRVTVGLVSAVDQAFRGPSGRPVNGGIEHTAPVARGSSGSPLVDASGRLLGVNTHRLGDGFYLALPATGELRDRVERLARGESPRPRRLGVALLPPPAARRLRQAVGLPERHGLLVRAVQEGSPAALAGVREGDLLVEAGGRPLRVGDDLFEAVDALPPGAALRLRVVRGVEELDLEVRLGGPAGDEA